MRDGRIWQQLPADNVADGAAWIEDGKHVHAETQIHSSSSIGDRVHFFRLEAEMQCWRDQFELKVTETVRTYFGFLAYSDAWTTLAKTHQGKLVGYAERAAKTAHTHAR